MFAIVDSVREMTARSPVLMANIDSLSIYSSFVVVLCFMYCCGCGITG